MTVALIWIIFQIYVGFWSSSTEYIEKNWIKNHKNDFSIETMHFWPHVGKAKMFGSFLKNCKQTAEKCTQIFWN